jgi:exonuclease SbcD
VFSFLHAADIHLDSPLVRLERYEGAPVIELRQATRRAFENLVQLAVAENVAFVLIAGDLYDGDWRDYNTGLFLVSQMTRLREADIRVFIVSGNHDAANKMTKTLRLPDNVNVFPTDRAGAFVLDDFGVAVHGQGFARPAMRKDLSAGYPGGLPGHFNIGMLHTCATGREGHEPYAPCTVAGLTGKAYQYWALGHVHQREVICDDPMIVFAGNIQGRNIRETGPKGCMLVDVDESGSIHTDFRPLDVIRWSKCHVDATVSKTGYDVVDRAYEQLEQVLGQSEGLPLVVRVEVTGMSPAHEGLMSDPERWRNEIRSAAIDLSGGRVWIEKVKILTSVASGRKTSNRSEGPLGELSLLIDEIRSDSTRMEGYAGILEDLWKKLPRELKESAERLGRDREAWIAKALEEVRPMLLGRLTDKENVS